MTTYPSVRAARLRRRLDADDAALRRKVTQENPVPMDLTLQEPLIRTLDEGRR